MNFVNFNDDMNTVRHLPHIKLDRQLSVSRDDTELIQASPSKLMRSIFANRISGCNSDEHVINESAQNDDDYTPRMRSMSGDRCDLLKPISIEKCSEDGDTNASSVHQSGVFNDAQSAGGYTTFSANGFEVQPDQHLSVFQEEASAQQPVLTQAERENFFAPIKVPEFKPIAESKVFVPAMNANVASFTPSMSQSTVDSSVKSQAPIIHEPSYKQKEKTELCKFWLRGEHCHFGDSCAFAHGEEELVKKTHVASKFRMTLCKSYLQAPYVCVYGKRCQFCHLERDFSDFDSQKTPFQNLLNENANIMEQRIAQVENPDISTFNIAMPQRSRLSVFANIAPEGEQCCKKNKCQHQKTQRNGCAGKVAQSAGAKRQQYSAMGSA